MEIDARGSEKSLSFCYLKIDNIFCVSRLTREGSAGFLVSASRYLKRKKDEWETNPDNINHFHYNMFHGNVTVTTMLILGAMNLMLH